MTPYRLVSRRAACFVVLAAFAMLAASCEKKAAPEEQGTVPQAVDSRPATPELSDANILATLIAANTGDIQNGQLAEPATKSPAVKAFATMMISGHSALNTQVSALATKLAITPEDDSVSLAITAHGDSVRTALGTMSGAAFDRAYIDNEVGLHEAVLAMLANSLVPAARSPELKALLLSARPAFESHLAQAKKVQGELAH